MLALIPLGRQRNVRRWRFEVADGTSGCVESAQTHVDRLALQIRIGISTPQALGRGSTDGSQMPDNLTVTRNMSIGYQNHLLRTPAGRGIATLRAVLAGASDADTRTVMIAIFAFSSTLFPATIPSVAVRGSIFLRGLLLGLLLCVLILLVLLTGDASY